MTTQNLRADRYLGYQQITSLAAATLLTVPAGTQLALVTPSVAAVRWTAGITAAPTATVGYPVAIGQEVRFTIDSLTTVEFIQQSAGAILDIVYFG